MGKIIEERVVLKRFPPLKKLMTLSVRLSVVEVKRSRNRGRILVTVHNGHTAFRINYPESDF